MILINRLVTAEFGWRGTLMNRLERAARELNRHDVLFYPEPMSFEKDRIDRNMLERMNVRVKQNLLHQEESIKWLTRMSMGEFRSIQKVIFLEVYQFPHVQMGLMGWAPLYEVFIHANVDLAKYPFYGAKAVIDYSHTFKRIVVQTPSTGASYGNVPYRTIGGFLELFSSVKPKRNAVMWSSNRAYDEAKGWLRFLEIVKAHPKVTFIVCVDKAFKEVFNYTNIECYEQLTSAEYSAKCREVKYILSTSETESFSYGLFDPISVGCIPLVTDRPFHTDWIPKKFVYTDMPDFTLEATDEELAAITDTHYYHRSFERLVAL